MESTTAIGMNVAIPHAKSDVVKQPIVAVMKNNHGVKWDSLRWQSTSIDILNCRTKQQSGYTFKILQRLSKR